MNGFERRRERKKHNILDASYALFSEYGVQKVSIQEIAQKAQVSQVTIYNYFGGKDQLLYETVRRFLNKRFTKSKKIINEAHGTFQDKIRTLLMDQEESFLHMYSGFVQNVSIDHPELHELISEFREKYSLPLLMDLIEQGKEEDAIHPAYSASVILAYIDMYVNSQQNKHNLYNQSPLQLNDELFQLFLYGLIGKQTKTDK